jgi:hypothetical protein
MRDGERPDDEPPPPDEGLRALVGADRRRAAPGDEAQEEIWRRVSATLAGGAGAPPRPAPRPPRARRPASGVRLAALGVALTAAGLALFPPGPPAGGGRTPEARERPAAGPAPARSALPPPAASPVAAPPPAGPAPRPPAAPDRRAPARRSPGRPAPVAPRAAAPAEAPRSAPADELAAERRLLDRARAALARRDGVGALVPLRAHGERHPRGQLGEERAAMTVVALALAGRRAEARAEAGRFRQRYPGSVFLDVLEESLDATP